MSTPRFLKCRCEQCRGPIEFPVEGVGTTVACPHCGGETDLKVPESTDTDRATSRTRAWAIGGVIVLVLLLVAAFVAVHLLRDIAPRVRRARGKDSVQQHIATPAARTTAPASPTVTGTTAPQPEEMLTNELTISAIGITTQPGSTLRHATGTVMNASTRRRFGLTVELQLLDAEGRELRQIHDYRAVLEPSARWNFRALVLDANAQSARVAAVREDR